MKRKSLKKLIFGLMLLCTFNLTLTAESTELPSGIEESKIADIVDGYVAEHRNTTAAVSAAVFRGYTVLFEKHYGLINIESGLQADENTVYEWGSVSKLLVWISVMQLWEQGGIELDTDINNYLPEGFLKKLKYTSPITMTNLMNHNAGWQDVLFLAVDNPSELAPLGETLSRMEPEHIYEPGKVCAYSNWGTSLAAYIVEQVSGMAYYDYVQQSGSVAVMKSVTLLVWNLCRTVFSI